MTMDSFDDADMSESVSAADSDSLAFGPIEALGAVIERLWLVCFGALGIGLLAFGATFLIRPTFTARTVFMPPQQQQSAAMAALGSLGGLASLAGSTGALKSPTDQYVALLQTRTVSDNILERFKLQEAYGEEYRIEARKELAKLVRIAAGKKDGLVTVEVDDKNKERAAAIANAYVDELRKLTATLAVTEAQQRRVFFERQLTRARDGLTKAQQDLESSGFSPGVLRAEPKAAAEGYAKLRAEILASEVRLQSLRSTLVDSTPEVQRQAAALATLRGQLAEMSSTTPDGDRAGYIGKYREFKYQETLFELFSKQYELARLDEAREGALIQVVEPAEVPEKRSKPKRAITAVLATVLGFLALSAFVVFRKHGRLTKDQPDAMNRRARWRAALSRP